MTEQEEEKPKWLLELESRKKKQRLGHETGAGAPCLACESACPGLDLHFWRKICKNCKCKGDEHDFDDDEFPQFELLFGPDVKNKRRNRSVLLHVNDKKQVQTEIPFEWVPPNTTKELAADYMKALPSDKMPITGSAGAVLRKQQLQKQLPLHDIDHKACSDLSEEEKKEFDKYLNHLKQCAGQGKVSKLMTIRPFEASLMTPANATDVKQFSPQHSQQLLKNSNGTLNLRTPSSFLPKMPSQPHRQTDVNPISSELIYSKNPSSIANEEYARGASCSSSVINSAISARNPITPNREVIRAYNSQTATSEVNPRPGPHHVSAEGSITQTANIPGMHHLGEHQASNINDQKYHLPKANSVSHELKHSKIPNLISSQEYVQACAAQQIGEQKNDKTKACIEKVGGNIEQNLEFSSNLPTNALLAEKMLSEALLPPSAINASDIVGSSLDQKELMYIREKLSDKYSNKTPMAPRELEHVSHHASISNSEEVKRNAEKARALENKSSQLTESNRNQLPYQSPYIPRTERIQAELNTSLPVQSTVIHSETLNNPVFPEDASGGATVALQNPDHIKQLQDEMQGMTMNSPKARQCHQCKEDVRCRDVIVTAEKIKDAVWHPGCFVCSACNELLVDLVYFTYKGKLYCARDLAELLEIPRCFACDELIFVREYTVAKGHNYHVKHFCCWECDIPLAGELYVTENDKPLCLPCYQKNYAKTCNACNSFINADQQGVAIKNLNFHATDNCFCCVTCKKSLLGGQIAIKEDRLLCSKECIAEFLHRRAMGR